MKEFVKRFALVLLAVLLLAQIPFIYRLFQLRSVYQKIVSLKLERVENSSNFKDYKGILHVHTALGGHSIGGFPELIAAAENNQLDFVIMTEHPASDFETAKQTLSGIHGGVLFVSGNEVLTADDERLLIPTGISNASATNSLKTADLLIQLKTEKKLALITYPEQFHNWNEPRINGTEVFSLHTNAKKINPLLAFFDLFWSWQYSPELTFARNFSRPADNLQKFDELTKQGRKLTMFAGSDAHSNIGLSFSDRANHDLLKIHLDPYERIFRLVRTHVLLPQDTPLTEENLLKAIENGNTFIAFDVFGDAGGFSFTAENGTDKKIMGDEIALSGGVDLIARAPLKSRFILFHNGEKVSETNDVNEFNFHAIEKGAYRLEVYLDSLGTLFAEKPWIISNPIYIR